MSYQRILNRIFIFCLIGTFLTHANENQDSAPKLRRLAPKQSPATGNPAPRNTQRSTTADTSKPSPIEAVSVKPNDDSVVQIDKDLSIQFPKIQNQNMNSYLFKPYPQEFVSRSVKLLHVILRDISPTLSEIEFTGSEESKFDQNLEATIFLGHYLWLLEFHPVFQIRKTSLEVVRALKDGHESYLLREIHLDPENKLTHLRDRLLQYPFEDVYSAHELYSRIQTHILPAQLNNTRDYDWILQKAADWMEPDLHHTYLSWLDQNPDYILQSLLSVWQKLVAQNIEESLPYVSKTYLAYNKNLLEILRLLEAPAPTVRKVELALEFGSLRFESYSSAPKIYQELAKMYPQFPGSIDYHKDDPAKSKLFFPFFDQIMNEAEDIRHRGRFSCVEALPPDLEVCKSLWGNAVTLYRYVVEWAPYRILTKQALEALRVIREENKSGLNLLSRPDYMKLMDKINKPYL